MEIQTQKIEGALEITPVGKCVFPQGFASLNDEVRSALVSGERLFVINLGKVTYMDEQNLEGFVGLEMEINASQGKLRICSTPPTIMAQFSQKHLNDVLSFYPTLREAMRSFG